MRVGFIGLGVMGRPMAANLVRAGHQVLVYNRSPGPVKELEKLGAKAGASPKLLAQESEVVITMLPDSPDVEAVALGEEGILHGAHADLTYVDMSTIAPQTARHLAEVFAQRHVSALDAPVSGGQQGAINGTLSIMVGGDANAFQRVRPLFEALGKTIVHMGASGMGQTVKLCNQVVCALTIEAMCEGLLLAKKAGADLEKVLQVVGAGLCSSGIWNGLAPRILRGDYEPGFKAKLQRKDLRLALALAEGLQVPLPGTGLAHQLFGAVEASGKGDKGTQALMLVLEGLAH
jgi:3-hydroxyisobutyrate dehydrogenase